MAKITPRASNNCKVRRRQTRKSSLCSTNGARNRRTIRKDGSRARIIISTKPAGKGDFSLTDKKTGKKAGSISFEQDQGSVKRAADLLQEATAKFPDRLDIWCGLAFIYQESGDFENEMSILRKMVAYAREHP